ncbi:hypothetical protein EB001_16975 [bacterium]|nr:hypothetical protein [bacterium]
MVKRIKDLREQPETFPDREAFLSSVRKKETLGQKDAYKAANPKSSARGAYQFTKDTWRAETKRVGIGSEYKSADQAPKEVQDEVMYRKSRADFDKYGNMKSVINRHYAGNPEGRVSAKGLAANRGQSSDKYYNDYQKNFASYKAPEAPKSTQVASQDSTPKSVTTATTPKSSDTTPTPTAEPKPTQVASAEPKMQNPDQNITKVASVTPAPSTSAPQTQISQLDTKPKEKIAEGTTMSQKEKINEAIVNLQENKLNKMKQNFSEVLQEKAMEKLEERKKVIAANYFAQ